MPMKTELETKADRHALTTLITLMNDSIVSDFYNGNNDTKKHKTSKILDELDSFFLGYEGANKEDSPLYNHLSELVSNNKDHEISILDIERIYDKEDPEKSIFEQSNTHIETIATSTPEGKRASQIMQDIEHRADSQSKKGVNPGEYTNLVKTDEVEFLNRLSQSGIVGHTIIDKEFLKKQKSLYQDLGIDLFDPNIYETKSVPAGIEFVADEFKLSLDQEPVNKEDEELSEGRKLLKDSQEYQHLYIEKERQDALEKRRKQIASEQIKEATMRDEIPFFNVLSYALTTPFRMFDRFNDYQKYLKGDMSKDTYERKKTMPARDFIMHEFDMKRDRIQNYQDKLKTQAEALAINELYSAKDLCKQIETKIANGEDYSAEKADFKDKVDTFKHFFDQQVTMLNGGLDSDNNPINPLDESDPDYLTAQNSIRIMLEEADKAQAVFEKSSDEDIQKEGKGLKKWLGDKLNDLGEVLSNGIKKIKGMLKILKEDEPKSEPETP